MTDDRNVSPSLTGPLMAEEEFQCENEGGQGFGVRHLQAAVMAAAAFIAYSHRTNLSVAIVAMARNNETVPEKEPAPTFDWDEETQGYLLSSFFWGYTLMQIPAGIITEKFGGHRFLCAAVMGSSILTLLIPQSAFWGDWVFVCMNRMCQGICQGFLFPSIYTLLGLWCPPRERSRLATISVGAQLFGVVATTPISGYLIKVYGWPTVFYTFGGVGIITSVVLFFLGDDSPARHRKISDEERRYIESSLGGAKVQVTVPWKQVITSVPYLSALLTISFYSLGYYILLTKIPTYLGTVLKFSIESNGVLSALPYLVAYILSFFFSAACDFLIQRGTLSISAARKVFNSIAHFGSASFIIAMGHVEDRTASVVLLCAFMACQAASFPGVQANFVDLAPNFSGPLFSVGNCTSSLLGIVGPILVGFIVTETGSAAQWRIVFYVCASVLAVSNVVYIIWGSAETQWWNWPDKYSGRNEYLKDAERQKEYNSTSTIST